MLDYLDQALDYLKDHKLVAASIAVLFFALLIRNFWFLVKLILVVAIVGTVVFLTYTFVGEAVKKKKELLKPEKSSWVEPIRVHAHESTPSRRLLASLRSSR